MVRAHKQERKVNNPNRGLIGEYMYCDSFNKKGLMQSDCSRKQQWKYV